MTDQSRLATQAIDAAVRFVACQTVAGYGGDPAKIIRPREVYPGAGQAYVEDRLDPNPALNATRALLVAAMAAERAAIVDARSLGMPWGSIAGSLGFYELPEPDLLGGTPSAAWRYAALGVMPDQEPDWTAMAARPEPPSVRWHCNGCHGLITETEPHHGPAESQTGHAPGCARLRDEIRGHAEEKAHAARVAADRAEAATR